MENGNPISNLSRLTTWLMAIQNSSWVETLTKAWKIGRNVIRGFASEGGYEILDYESTLEIHNPAGTRATFQKLIRVRYLQDNIIAFQDYAWGDGDILINYRTSRGKQVDRYRSGYKTYILISLRDVKNRGDMDEFDIQWDIRQGFLTKDGYWGADISQLTKHLKVNVIFPKSRPPLQIKLEENHRQQTHILGREAQKQLPDGRWLVTWETDNPTLYELYVIRWIW